MGKARYLVKHHVFLIRNRIRCNVFFQDCHPSFMVMLMLQLTPEMEKALLQQVMSLTPEQINFLPPEQRNQVLQLQQMLR